MEGTENGKETFLGHNISYDTNDQLLTNIDTGKGIILNKLLEGYFSMIENIDNIDNLINNLDYYNGTLSKLIDFSEQMFMQETIWKICDDGNIEYCSAHLRNLLSPFMNIIALIKGVSNGDIKEDVLKNFIKKSILNLKENKNDFQSFCDFLNTIK